MPDGDPTPTDHLGAPQSLSFDNVDGEEDLKVLYLVPLLERLGLHRFDLQLERSFSFKAGRQKLHEDLGQQLREKRPRLDLLMTRDGRNLFIIEAKRPGQELTENDALQAISYARLVHPIAPYAIVTNGSQSRLYHTVTREEIDPKEALIDGTFEVVLPSADDFEALDSFLRLSLENLLRFSRAQLDTSLTQLRGSAADPTKKYIPDVHVPRQHVDAALQELLHSSQSALALVADSGIGKTCTMCHCASAILDAGHAVLFFRGTEVGSSLVQTISDELAWTFTEHLSPPALMRRLARVLGDRRLLIFIDAIDEWQRDDAYQQLGSLARHLPTTVKLVVSCKSSAWPLFLERLGVKTDFEACLLRHNDRPGLLLTTFSDFEFYSALRKYEQFYGFHGVWDKSLLEEARRSPFFMRIAFEVARDLKLTQLRETRREIFEGYFEGCLGKVSRRPLSQRLLEAVAKALFESNSDRIEVERLRALLGLGVLDDLPEEPFLSGALERVPGTNSQSATVRFVFDGLRNYVIALKACRWHEQSAGALRKMFDRAAAGVQVEAFLAYYRLASEGHKRVLDHRCYPAAVRFLAAYKAIVQEHFAPFASSFPLGDLAHTGLVIEANLQTGEGYGYGLRRLKSEDAEILILPAASDTWVSDSLLRWGAGGLSYRLTIEDWLHTVDPYHELLRTNIAQLVQKIVQAGALNERHSPDLAMELLAAAVLSKPDLLNEPNRGPGAEGLPLTAGRIRYWLLLQQHWNRLEDELVERKLLEGAIPFQQEGATISYEEPPLSEDERQELRHRSDALIAQGAAVDGPRLIPLDDLADRLKVAIAVVGEDAVIAQPLFPEASKYWRRPPWTAKALDELRADQHRFLSLFLVNYQRLIAGNFPTLKEHFALFRRLPVLLQVAVHPSVAPGQDPFTFVDFFAPDGFALEDNVIEPVEFADRVSLARVRTGAPIFIGGRPFKWFLGQNGMVLHHLRGSHRRHPNVGRAEDTVVRDFTYSWIERELAEVISALGRAYGLPDLRP
jgi:Type I restriction enzyme R protein N terminus (HSDR_N)